MGQHLQGIERGIDVDAALGQQALYGIGKAEEQRVAGSKDHNLPVCGILREHLVQRHDDVYPLRPFGQEPFHQLVMTHAPRKHLPPGDDFLHPRRKINLGAVADADNME